MTLCWQPGCVVSDKHTWLQRGNGKIHVHSALPWPACPVCRPRGCWDSAVWPVIEKCEHTRPRLLFGHRSIRLAQGGGLVCEWKAETNVDTKKQFWARLFFCIYLRTSWNGKHTCIPTHEFMCPINTGAVRTYKTITGMIYHVSLSTPAVAHIHLFQSYHSHMLQPAPHTPAH